MQNVYEEVNSLDKRCYEELFLTPDILMEHAANALKNKIDILCKKSSKILIVSGVGNNGADGIALARLLYTKYKNVNLYLPFEVKSKMAQVQLKRAKLLNINIVKNLACDYDLIVDCLFGSGLNKPLNKDSIKIIDKLNLLKGYKIACDIPSGIDNKGNIQAKAFEADYTITMGALKKSLFTDFAKDYVGKISIATLGLSRKEYESNKTNIFLLEKSDMKLPFRNQKSVHKGSFGHACIVVGCKKGAGILASLAAFSFGSGLVTALVHEELDIEYNIMQSHNLPKNTTALAIGMGLGLYEKKEIKKLLDSNIKKVIDADLFYDKLILDVLKNDIVLTPHPKEFCSLLKLCNIADISIKQLQENRFFYLEEFSNKYPKVTILLKGANTLIANNSKIYINSFGRPSLSKGGSGDVLSGLIVALLAQGYGSLESAITASLAHSFASRKFKKNSYALSPYDLINKVKTL